MMNEERIVTDIREFSKQKYSIYVNEEFAFVLYRGELSAYGLKVGKPLGEKEYHQIYGELLPKRAKKRCLNLLKSRAYTEKGLRNKLREGGYPPDIIEEAIGYVKSFHYIDDYDYACQYIRCHKEGKSRKRIEERLREKGVPKELVEQAFLDTYESGEEEQLMLRQAQHHLEKKGYVPDSCDWKEKQKLYGFLLRKGIPTRVIRRVLEGIEDY